MRLSLTAVTYQFTLESSFISQSPTQRLWKQNIKLSWASYRSSTCLSDALHDFASVYSRFLPHSKPFCKLVNTRCDKGWAVFEDSLYYFRGCSSRINSEKLRERIGLSLRFRLLLVLLDAFCTCSFLASDTLGSLSLVAVSFDLRVSARYELTERLMPYLGLAS